MEPLQNTNTDVNINKNTNTNKNTNRIWPPTHHKNMFYGTDTNKSRNTYTNTNENIVKNYMIKLATHQSQDKV